MKINLLAIAPGVDDFFGDRIVDEGCTVGEACTGIWPNFDTDLLVFRLNRVEAQMDDVLHEDDHLTVACGIVSHIGPDGHHFTLRGEPYFPVKWPL